MKYFQKNKFLIGVLFAAVMSLAVFSIGGEYLHSQIHKHESQTAHQQCPIYQLQTQVFTAISVFTAALFSAVVSANIFRFTQLLVLQPQYIHPESHAPPFSL